MAQGPLITQEIQRLIAEIFDKHTNWTAQEIQGEVHRLLKLEKRSGLKEDWPALSTIQRELTKIRSIFL